LIVQRGQPEIHLAPFAERLCKPLAVVPETLGTIWSQSGNLKGLRKRKPLIVWLRGQDLNL
jgi:hypothetical protein